VVLTFTAVALGLVIGLCLPARRTRFARPRVHKPALLVAGVVGQVVAVRLHDQPAASLMLLSLVLLTWFAIANLHLTGMGVVAIGLCSNIIPIVLNQGMPVRPKALVHANVVAADELTNVDLSGGRHLEGPNDRMVALADIIPVPAAQQVVSFGDLIIFVATIDVIVHLVRRQRRAPAHARGRHAPPSGYGEPTFDLRDSTIAKHVQDWGEAPRPLPSSGSQNSENADVSAPRTVVSATRGPASHNK
jgi:hypothetical protein